MRRRIGAPWRLAGLLVLLAALPLATLLVGVDESARASVVHIAVSYVVLLAAFRVLGKRELGRLSPFELVTLMLIPEILSNTLQGEASLVPGLAGLCVILFLVLLSSALAQRFRVVQRVVEPEPTLLVLNGRILTHNMNLERIAPDELESEMRKQGLADLSQVRFAVLEGSGNITFVPRAPGDGARASEDNDVRP